MDEEMDLRHVHRWRRKKEARQFGFMVLVIVTCIMAGCGYTAFFSR